MKTINLLNVQFSCVYKYISSNSRWCKFLVIHTNWPKSKLSLYLLYADELLYFKICYAMSKIATYDTLRCSKRDDKTKYGPIYSIWLFAYTAIYCKVFQIGTILRPGALFQDNETANWKTWHNIYVYRSLKIQRLDWNLRSRLQSASLCTELSPLDSWVSNNKLCAMSGPRREYNKWLQFTEHGVYQWLTLSECLGLRSTCISHLLLPRKWSLLSRNN